MDRKRNHFAGALVAVLTAAVIFEVYYFGFQLPGEEALEKRNPDDSTARHRQEQAAIKQQVAARAVHPETESGNK